MSEGESTDTRGDILIVDDTLANLRLLTDMLRDQGFKVRGVRSGPMAINAAQSAAPDLILLDINMPELFLDEVGDMPLAIQAKILRTLEDGQVQPLGTGEERSVDVRVLAATNAELQRGELLAECGFVVSLFGHRDRI